MTENIWDKETFEELLKGTPEKPAASLMSQQSNKESATSGQHLMLKTFN